MAETCDAETDNMFVVRILGWDGKYPGNVGGDVHGDANGLDKMR